MKKCLTFGFVLLVVLLGAAILSKSGIWEPEKIESIPSIASEVAYVETLSLSDVVSYFTKIAKEHGGAYAFELLRNTPSNTNVNAHMIGHAIGVELYREEGIQGLRVCTAEFAFSCYHSVLASVLADVGLSAIPDLNAVCLSLDDWWGCQHGIGHGVLSITGYDQVLQALEICESLSAYGKITGCVEGVFMEFNSLTMLDTSGTSQREVSFEGIYYPCTAVGSSYQDTCYYELPSWWRGLYGQESYAEIGASCDAIENQEHKAWCFRRIGFLRLDAPDGTTQNAAEKCMEASTNPTNQAHCLQMLKTEVSTDIVCDLLQSPYREVCESDAPER